MAPHSLPERPNLEQLRTLARELQRDTGTRLSSAQRDLARRYGFTSWPRLQAHVRAIEERTWSWSAPAPDEPAAHRFLRATTVNYTDGPAPDPDTARRIRDDDPGLSRSDLAVAAVCGDVDAVRRLATSGVDTPRGPFGWPALMYVTYSRFDVGEDATLATARALLAAGADPDEGRYFAGYPTSFTVLTGAFGSGEGDQPPHPHALPLARLLLEAGAEANDAQTLYNRMFATDDDFLSLLFEFGLGAGDGGPWRKRLPDLSMSPTELVRALLDWAVSHGQRDRVRLLVAHDVDVTTPSDDGRTPLATALVHGHRDVAEVLRSAGVTEPQRSPSDVWIGAVLAGDRTAAADPEVVATVRATRPGLIVWAAAQGHPDAVGILARAGFDIDALARGDLPSDQPWQSALHSAVEHDRGDVVRRLLELGARRDIRDARFGGTPADWARHFDRPHLEVLLDE